MAESMSPYRHCTGNNDTRRTIFTYYLKNEIIVRIFSSGCGVCRGKPGIDKSVVV